MKRILLIALSLALPLVVQAAPAAVPAPATTPAVTLAPGQVESMTIGLNGPSDEASMKALVVHLLTTPGVTAVRSNIPEQSVYVLTKIDIDDCALKTLLAAQHFTAKHVDRTPPVTQPKSCPSAP